MDEVKEGRRRSASWNSTKLGNQQRMNLLLLAVPCLKIRFVGGFWESFDTIGGGKVGNKAFDNRIWAIIVGKRSNGIDTGGFPCVGRLAMVLVKFLVNIVDKIHCSNKHTVSKIVILA